MLLSSKKSFGDDEVQLIDMLPTRRKTEMRTNLAS